VSDRPPVLPSPPAASGPLAALCRVARSETIGGALLLIATAAALVLSNSAAAEWYEAVRDAHVGIPALRLELSVGEWASDGLLAVFFFVVGLELKEEIVAGRLRDPRQAAVPVAAALGGVVVPALLFVAVNLSSGAEALRGWAIPTATDAAFAVAVLAVAGRGLPAALRTFLLTLAVVDDLVAITIIAVVYAHRLDLIWLLVALVPLALFSLAVRRGVRAWWLLIPLAVAVWALVHASGVHATVAGVLLGFVVPAVAPRRGPGTASRDPGHAAGHEAPATLLADRWNPISTLLALPVFALFAAGVRIDGLEGLANALTDPVALGIMAGLVIGKPLGILGAALLLGRSRSLRLDAALRWPDLVGMAFAAGIGFTVSLLVGELAYGPDSASDEHAKIGILAGSLLAAVVGSCVLAARARRTRRSGAEPG